MANKFDDNIVEYKRARDTSFDVTMAGQTCRVTLVDGVVVLMEFKNMTCMTVALEEISTFAEGKTALPRTGHNFSIQHYKDYCKRTQGKYSKTPIGRLLHQCCEQGAAYVVGCVSGDKQTKAHELRHAKYFVDAAYRAFIMDMWHHQLSDKERITVVGFLTRLGYPKHVMIDEFQAYLYTEKANFFGVPFHRFL